MPSASDIVDFRSDTVTAPTDAMRKAIREADYGDSFDCDPEVIALEELAASLLNVEASVFVPSGLMANQLGLMAVAPPGSEVICGKGAHISRYEKGAASLNCRLQVRELCEFSVFDSEALASELDRLPHEGKVGCVAIENTHMSAGGKVWPLRKLASVSQLCREEGLPIHCDGARLFNASVASGVPAHSLVKGFTTVSICLSKGLCAPVGSLLAGPLDLMTIARRAREQLGGSMTQAAGLAAAGRVALTTMISRLVEDHSRAQIVYSLLADIFPSSVDGPPETNIVLCNKSALPGEMMARLSEQSILVSNFSEDHIRFVTHHDIDDSDLQRLGAALAEIAP